MPTTTHDIDAPVGPSFRWTSGDLKALVDLSEKETVHAALDKDDDELSVTDVRAS